MPVAVPTGRLWKARLGRDFGLFGGPRDRAVAGEPESLSPTAGPGAPPVGPTQGRRKIIFKNDFQKKVGSPPKLFVLNIAQRQEISATLRLARLAALQRYRPKLEPLARSAQVASFVCT